MSKNPRFLILYLAGCAQIYVLARARAYMYYNKIPSTMYVVPRDVSE